MNAAEFSKKVRSSEIDIVEHIHKVIEKCRKINNDFNYFNTISDELAIKQAHEIRNQIKNKDNNIQSKKLLGIAVSVKDSICVQGVESTAGSRILKGYRPLFDASVVRKVREQGGIIIGKTSQDEFGFGGFSVNVGVGFKTPKNPFDPERSCGGSSGGAGGIVQKADFPHIALGESTGGSIAAPASFCGVFGLCPTYGRVSRYGLIDFGNSLDKIGSMGKTVDDTALLLDVIAGHDALDSTSLNAPKEDYGSRLGKGAGGMKIGIIKEAFEEGNDPEVESKVNEGIEKLKENGMECEEISLKLPIRYGLSVYYMIATSEASTNLAKYCGMRYGAAEKLEGNFNEYFSKVRSHNLGDEAKRRIIIGTFARMSGFRDAYYIKAAKVRTLIIQEYRKAFKKFDALVSPSVPILPPKFSDIEKLTPLQNYMADILLVGPNIAGLPHLNVPVGFEKGLPVGMLLTGDHLQEGKLLQIGSIFGERK
ncbi:Asp-tRNA(Asn)/Glu-tRNA(Gln) amidotransferase subunit GatA [Candidatus Woesearchaeota archaeon]|nr:Asp-tRNA(Asn)/Glu-tRNA(Gln) amidotransferase subunit GatA [Candidatus Woesearchaeota archaeon]